MAISRSLMNRQLQANGGIMQVAPREKFGLGSKLKKFVRKIIPNEISEIAVKAAPFIAPFNPAVAAAMSGLGTFDQTGSISAGLKSGAMNYGGGQLARYAGGAGFQGNPFGDGGAFTGGLQGFKGGFTTPIGKETGLGKFFSNRGTAAKEGVQGIDMATGGADGVGVIQDAPTTTLANASELSYVPEPSIDMVTGGADGVGIIQDTVSENMLLPKVKPIIAGSPKQMTITESIQKILSPNSTMTERGGEALNLLKRTGKAAFTKEGKNGPVPDKAAILGAVAFAGSYAEARALAAETGIDPDLTEAEYDELAKAEKKEEYASYLTNFFGGQKDGGRIGFKSGYSPGVVSAALEEYNSVYGTDGSGEEILVKDLYSGGFDEFLEIYTGDAYEKRANGGRIGYAFGTKPEEAEVGIMTIDVEAGDDEDEEDMMMAYSDAIFNRPEKAALFRALGDPKIRQTTKSFKNLNNILKNPGMFPEDEFVLKQYLKLKGFKDGGRIGLKDGTSDKELEEILATDMTISNNPNDPRNMTTEEIIAVINSGRSTPELFEELLLRNTGGVNEIDMDEGQAFSFNERGATSDGAIENLLFKLRESNPDIYGDYNRPRKSLPTAEPNFFYAETRAKGGRIGLKGGSGSSNRVAQLILERDYLLSKDEDVSYIDVELESLGYKMRSEGGVMDVKMPTGQMRKNNAGVVERDYRDEGGFVPVGIKERADDVPAMLSKNEFVMTADAVRGIGNGSVEEGSKKLYNTMKQAEKVGKA